MNQVSERARRLYDDSVVIDGLNVSNWDSDSVYESLNEGGVAAINATIATWENYRETLDHISRWLARFRERSDRILQVETVDDIHQRQARGQDRCHPRLAEHVAHREPARPARAIPPSRRPHRAGHLP